MIIENLSEDIVIAKFDDVVVGCVFRFDNQWWVKDISQGYYNFITKCAKAGKITNMFVATHKKYVRRTNFEEYEQLFLKRLRPNR